ncbi:MAG: sulfite exporter TauE/SafE family protein [Desulfurococcales archaeon]|nr:sulfite exporter TauE/SafE family protein [Desulfurococcales archaeon]
MLSNLLMLFAGALGIGFVSAIAGIGGGSLMVPFMVLVLNYDVKVAIATSLLCIVVTSCSAASVYLRRGTVDVKTALLLEPTTALGAIVGAYITLTLPVKVVKGALGALLLYVSVTMLRKALKRAGRGQADAMKVKIPPLRKLLGVLVSFLAGMTSGMFGIGGGVLKVPLMALIMGLPIKIAVATSSFMVGLTAASGGVVYLMKGFTDPLSVIALAAGIIPGATLGARYLRRLEPRAVRLVFSLILLYASVRLLYSLIT